MTLIGDIVGNFSNLGNCALLIINGYVLGVIWGNLLIFWIRYGLKVQIKMFKTRLEKALKKESDISYPENALHMYAENYPTVKHNRKILDKLPRKT